MAIKGSLYGVRFGQDTTLPDSGASSIVTFAMAALNTGWSARFLATTTKDIYSVRVNWSAVATPGQVTVRVETDSSGKPSGTLYDANAVMTAQTPTLGTQTFTFGTPPATGLTIGNAYHLVILTTTGGTTQTLRSSVNSAVNPEAGYPQEVLTAADGTTRTNFADVTDAIPIGSLVLSDGSEDSMGMVPTSGAANNINLVTTGGNAILAGLKWATTATLVVAGYEFIVQKVGTPTANLRIRTLDSSNNVVANSTATISLNHLANASNRRGQFFALPAGVLSFAPGTYRTVLDGAADTSTSNCWRVNSTTAMNTASAASGFAFATPSAYSGGNPTAWTDTPADQVAVRLILDSITASGGSMPPFMRVM